VGFLLVENDLLDGKKFLLKLLKKILASNGG
jgi:hypothetical protein